MAGLVDDSSTLGGLLSSCVTSMVITDRRFWFKFPALTERRIKEPLDWVLSELLERQISSEEKKFLRPSCGVSVDLSTLRVSNFFIGMLLRRRQILLTKANWSNDEKMKPMHTIEYTSMALT